MQQYPNAGDGLKKMFIAAIGAIICAVVAVIPFIGIIGGIGAIVFMVISLLGLNNLSKDISGCKTAFTLTIVNLVVSVLSTLLGSKVPVLPGLLGIAENVLSLLIVYYVCIPVSDELGRIGANDVANSGQTVWKWNLVCYIIIIVFAVIGLIPLVGDIIQGIGSVLVAIPMLIAEILYLIFLNKSSHAFGA